jgi:CheY-like chemotaxis protein
MLLDADGFSVREAANGPDGIVAVQAHEPDVALVDIGLPGLDGYAVARAIRASGNTRTLLVALTGYGQPSDARAAMEAGFDRHLVKPVDFEALLEVMKAERTAQF